MKLQGAQSPRMLLICPPARFFHRSRYLSPVETFSFLSFSLSLFPVSCALSWWHSPFVFARARLHDRIPAAELNGDDDDDSSTTTLASLLAQYTTILIPTPE